MITLEFDFQRAHANAFSRRAEAVLAVDGSEVEFTPLGRGAASDPVTELQVVDEPTQITEARSEIVLPDDRWTCEREQRFAKLAEREVLGTLKPGEKDELEHLSNTRRALKNPRDGEELLWEYEQRKLTRDLVEALNRYVSFHQTARRSQSA